MIDWTVTIGNIVQVIGLVGAAFSVFFGLSYRIKGVEREMEKLSNVVVTLAVQTTQIEHLRKRIDELSELRMRELDEYPKILKRHQI
jgi:5-enolpyruvylshikimate-3-phosphate synthase